VLFYLKDRGKEDKRKRIVQTKSVFVEDKSYGRQGNSTQRNEIMNTSEELKCWQVWTLE
jgi:hypothetical protein